jgi:hypothetical protein
MKVIQKKLVLVNKKFIKMKNIRMNNWLVAILLCGIFIICASTISDSLHDDQVVAYPSGYRMWTHVKTGLIGPQNPNFQFSGGYHHIYANAKAMQGYSSGSFPEGSVLVFDVLNTKEQNGNTAEADRKNMGVMAKDSIKFKSTGGWGYEQFDKDSQIPTLTQPLKMQCFACHSRRKDNDFVFSSFRK